jgi:hypothetical protein
MGCAKRNVTAKLFGNPFSPSFQTAFLLAQCTGLYAAGTQFALAKSLFLAAIAVV